MDPVELVFSILLVVVLLVLAGYFGYRQVRALRRLREQTDLSPEDRRFYRKQARRRLVVSVLMVLLALMLAGNPVVDSLFRDFFPADKEAGQGAAQERTPEKEAFEHFLFYYSAICLLLVLIILCLGVVDGMAIGRFGMRQYRQLQTESRSILQEQADRLRRERNGHS
jgi:hypothetical protein